MRCVILGGTGQIGTATASRFVALGAVVTIVSRKRPDVIPPGVEWRTGDVTDAQALHTLMENEKPDSVIHLAAYLQFACEENPREAVRVNVDGTVNVLEACRQNGVRRVVFGSSIAAYGERHDLMREGDAPSANAGLYGMTKHLGEMIGVRYSSLYGLTFVALRYSGVFGPAEVHSSGMALVRQKIKECASGRDVVVEGASGNERVHLTHVIDVAEATCRAALHPAPAHPIYNVGGPDGNYAALKEFHAAVKALVPGAGAAVWRGQGRSAGPVDTRRLREDLGVEPRVSIAEGLQRDLALRAD